MDFFWTHCASSHILVPLFSMRTLFSAAATRDVWPVNVAFMLLDLPSRDLQYCCRIVSGFVPALKKSNRIDSPLPIVTKSVGISIYGRHLKLNYYLGLRKMSRNESSWAWNYKGGALKMNHLFCLYSPEYLEILILCCFIAYKQDLKLLQSQNSFRGV